MDTKHNLEYRNNDVCKAVRNGSTLYDYAENGILNKCLPSILFKGNTLFVTFLQIIEQRLVMLLKYIDKVHNFKNIGSYY